MRDQNTLIARPKLLEGSEAASLFKEVRDPDHASLPLFYPEPDPGLFGEKDEINWEVLQQLLQQKTDIRPWVLEAFLLKKIGAEAFTYLSFVQSFVLDHVPEDGFAGIQIISLNFPLSVDQLTEDQRYIFGYLKRILPHWANTSISEEKVEQDILSKLATVKSTQRFGVLIPARKELLYLLVSELIKMLESTEDWHRNPYLKELTDCFPEGWAEAKERYTCIDDAFYLKNKADKNVQIFKAAYKDNKNNPLLMLPIKYRGKFCYFMPYFSCERVLLEMAYERYNSQHPLRNVKPIEILVEPGLGVLDKSLTRAFKQGKRMIGLSHPNIRSNIEVHGFRCYESGTAYHDLYFHYAVLAAAGAMAPFIFPLMDRCITIAEAITRCEGNRLARQIADFPYVIFFYDIESFDINPRLYWGQIALLALSYHKPAEQNALLEYAIIVAVDILKNPVVYEKLLSQWPCPFRGGVPRAFELIHHFFYGVRKIIGGKFFLRYSEKLTAYSYNVAVFCCLMKVMRKDLAESKIFEIADQLQQLEQADKITFRWADNDGQMLNIVRQRTTYSFRFQGKENDCRTTRDYSNSKTHYLFPVRRIFSCNEDWLPLLEKRVEELMQEMEVQSLMQIKYLS